jgi:hypothetical protein
MAEVTCDRAPEKIPGKKQGHDNQNGDHYRQHRGHANCAFLVWLHSDSPSSVGAATRPPSEKYRRLARLSGMHGFMQR